MGPVEWARTPIACVWQALASSTCCSCEAIVHMLTCYIAPMNNCRGLRAQAQETRQGLESAVGKTLHWRQSSEEQQALLKHSSGHASQLQVIQRYKQSNTTSFTIFADVCL